MYDIIIVGAGPAGLTAAIYALRASKKVLLLEAKTYGGQIITTPDVDNYPGFIHISGIDFATNLYNQVKELDAEIKYEKVIDIKDCEEYKEVTTEKHTYQGRTVILATGSDNRKLGLENEDLLLGKGISYCATCDGNFYKGKVVAVTGGGNTALEEAMYLTNIAKRVYLIHRRDEFRGEKRKVNSLSKKDNIRFIYNSNITKINKKYNKLDSIEITSNDGKVKELNIDGLFIAIGRIPENQNFAKLINLEPSGYIDAEEDCHTNVEGIYVAGDCRKKELRQLVTATSDGAVAATEAIKYINKNYKEEEENV